MTEAQTAPTARTRWEALVVIALFSLLPGVSVGGAIGLPLLLGLGAVASFDPKRPMQTIENAPLFLSTLAAFVLWSAFSSLWSPWDGVANLKIIALLAIGILFGSVAASAHRSSWTLASAVAALTVLILLIAIEAATDSMLNRGAAPTADEFTWRQNPARGAVVMLALLWPAIAWILSSKAAWRWPFAISLLAGASFASLQFGQHSNLLGLCIGATFFGLALCLPRFAILLSSLGLAGWLAIAPFATLAVTGSIQAPAWLPHSWDVRLGIWRYTSERILEKPVFGHGLEAARATTEMTAYDGESFRVIPVHPHSASLQIWYESGAIGAALAITLLVCMGLQLSRAYSTPRLQAAAAASVIAMLGSMANIGWSLWQEWWMATIILSGILVAALGNQVPRRNT